MKNESLECSRRQLVTSVVASSFALSMMPAIGSSVISTSDDGLESGESSFKTNDGDMMLYFAKPKAKLNLPVIIVVQEIFGLHEHIRDLCRRLAQKGFLAVAPNLYQRQGDPTKIADINELIDKVVRQVPDVQVMGDLDACVAQLATWGGDKNRVGITGFCWGGRITWLYSAHSKTIKAGVAWYGRLKSTATDLQPLSPIDIAGKLNCPMLGLYGEADTGIPMDTVTAMRDALMAQGSTSHIVSYPDAPHGFNADYRPSYRETIASDAWGKMLQWFEHHGVK
jgi:carboxymethylenebutenolidase